MELYSVLYRTVEAQNLAMVMGSGDLPVLATPQMIAWMEEASCNIAETKEGYTTVGISMNVTHDAPSPLHARIRIVSHLIETNGKIFTFEVGAYCNDTCIGKGVHQRAAVNRERFMVKVNAQA